MTQVQSTDDAARRRQPAPKLRIQVLNGIIEIGGGRLSVSDSLGATLDVGTADIRRVQLDIEALRPATLAFVPSSSRHAPVVLAVGPESYRAVADALVMIGEDLANAEAGAID